MLYVSRDRTNEVSKKKNIFEADHFEEKEKYKTYTENPNKSSFLRPAGAREQK